MSFDIRFLSGDESNTGVDDTHLFGRITLGEDFDDFVSCIGFWCPEDYHRHWTDAVQRVVHKGCDSCLITSISDPTDGGVARWWLLYPRGETVHVQEALLLFDRCQPFSVDDPYACIPPRKTETDEGLPVSEWSLPLSDFAVFLIGRA